ncbi:hypothetical protein MMC13_007631 [Lambiella insularis]|nr:hypothetical protein [Lambiella insularis]
MSEYWKSTPKYWCKHCKTYVRDSKLEKQNHEATPKHQGNIKRFLRDLHRGNERNEREKQRAKDEVTRLNGAPGASAEPGAGHSVRQRTTVVPSSSCTARQATPAERKQQMAKLAELGVAVPDEYRREVAMAGDWQVLSERTITERIKMEEEGGEEIKSDGLNFGVRKRKLEGQDEEEEAVEPSARRIWGSTTRTYPGSENSDGDLDSLLNATSTAVRGIHSCRDLAESRVAPTGGMNEPSVDNGDGLLTPGASNIKKEESADDGAIAALPSGEGFDAPIKEEDHLAGAGVVFKKRKAKVVRQP